jgi:hypothetical protein
LHDGENGQPSPHFYLHPDLLLAESACYDAACGGSDGKTPLSTQQSTDDRNLCYIVAEALQDGAVLQNIAQQSKAAWMPMIRLSLVVRCMLKGQREAQKVLFSQ